MIKLVIVEDDLMVAEVNRKFALHLPEIELVATFYNGREALDFLCKNEIDLILLDVYMSGCDGVEILRELRNNGKTSDVVMITAANDGGHIEEALRLGVIDYLVKPFTHERFNAALQKVLMRRSLRSDEKYKQDDIDKLLQKAHAFDRDNYPLKKGMQKQTMEKIFACLFNEKNNGKYLTSDQISEETKLSKVTIRRYMNYLIERNDVTGRVNYSTGGRPKIEYLPVSR